LYKGHEELCGKRNSSEETEVLQFNATFPLCDADSEVAVSNGEQNSQEVLF